jgi:hypothetical protein
MYYGDVLLFNGFFGNEIHLQGTKHLMKLILRNAIIDYHLQYLRKNELCNI